MGSSNDETNFSHKLLLTDTQVSKVRKDFAIDISAKKIINKAGELSKKVTLNDMIETANFSKNVINASKKVFGGNNPNKQ